jgi:hypothetical protein
MAAVADEPLGKIPDLATIEFDEFNVTRESDGKHFYFDEHGNVVWKKTQREASLEDPGWDAAVTAALVIYGLIGVGATEDSLYRQLHDMGRHRPVSPRDAAAKPKPAATVPASSGKKFAPVPRALMVNKGLKPPTPSQPTAPQQMPSTPIPTIPPQQPDANYHAVPHDYGTAPMDLEPENLPENLAVSELGEVMDWR